MTEIVAADLVESPSAGALDASLVATDAGRSLWRELAAIGLTVVLCDVTLYRGHGYAGLALLFLLAPLLLLLGSPRPHVGGRFVLVAGMLLLLSARLVWLGHALAAGLGFALVVACAMTLRGRCPYVLDVLAGAVQTIAAGAVGLVHYARSANQLSPRLPRFVWLTIGLPVAALVLFGTLFVLANPDLVTSFVDFVDWAWRSLCDSLDELLPTWAEVLVWLAAAWVMVGLLRPILTRAVDEFAVAAQRPAASGAASDVYFAAVRNTLTAVIVLFAAYLVFEFKTLWFRVFPPGFYYAGYAHEGAAWLTVALALATAVLSAAFRGRLLYDPRLPSLRRLAWIWSAENLILAAAVYNRMAIYVHFNGMTRMRTVGLFGISAVVVGFLLVVWKIVQRRDFVWLLRRHLWTVAMAAYLFALTPVDALVHRYNVRRIMAGDLAPSVQISVHPLSSQGVLVLPPLLGCRDATIREGTRALLAERALQAEAQAAQRDELGWTTFQCADRALLRRLDGLRSEWQEYTDPKKRAAALERFHTYVYQWY